MKTLNLYIGHTFHGDSEELSGIFKDNTLTNVDAKFITVELNILGGHSISEFSDLNKTIDHLKNHNLVYRFVESVDKTETRRIIVLHNIIRSDKIVGYHNFYGIGGDWKLYLNGKSDIVIQHIQFPKIDITVRFRDFPLEKEFYVYLSCLIYTLTNYELKTELEIRTTFNKIKNYSPK